MEDIFKFLLVLGVIVVGFVRQAKKEAQKKAANNPTLPVPERGNPLPGNRSEGTYGGYIPEGPRPVPQNSTKEPSRYTASSLQQQAPSTPVIEETDATPEFEIHSAEEARRAIVWGEILQRKY